MATSPFKRTYADAGIFSKTPIKPRLSSVAAGSSSSSPTDVSPTDASSENRFASTIVADDGSIPTKKSGRQEADALVEETVSLPIPKPTFTSVSPVARALVPADWDQRYDPSQQPFSFNPDQSPEGMETYTVLSKQSPSTDGTIASLRQAVVGDRFVPSMSTPFRSTSVHPISPAPPGSPPQSPRQITPFPVHDYASPPRDDDTRESSVGVHFLPPLPPARSALSRSPTVEAEDVELKSPSADTLQEELSVLDMMGSPRSETHSNIASPAPWRPRAESQPPVPSSVSPPPMQLPQTSPPRLRLSIPGSSSSGPFRDRSPSTPSRQGSAYPSAADLFDDPFMSPLSPSTPSQVMSRPVSPASASSVLWNMDIPVPPPESERRSISMRSKKRKAKAQEAATTQEQGPPPKRRKSKAGLGPSAKQEKARKKIKKVKAEGDPVMWPEMTLEEDVVSEFVGKFIGCDRCERWYHFTCLGIGPGDSRLEGEFLCPLCVAGHALPPEGSKDDDGSEAQCSRPGCPIQDKFFVPAGIFGRYTKLSSTHGRVSLWLVFWEGYKWEDATWEPTRPSDEAVEEFERRAAEEGINLDDDSVSCIMLSEAREGGVNDPELI
ncbi:hypothetical protein DFH08DRAFT_891548 [Mycena albidolilacea]|uniref:Zinc finger PHD-type domain-containing protein n=1 Tax=Mycena albidolilacea TaxID=1033008 RepID=A0AAD6ZEA8_9AGAR|nr:hypothetical protein DFH08DRAFT_891548 [Mycena albidolilacea]